MVSKPVSGQSTFILGTERRLTFTEQTSFVPDTTTTWQRLGLNSQP
jgi:hypothetical protein